MAGLPAQSTANDIQLTEACDELGRRLAAGDTQVAEAVLAAYPGLAADPDSALQIIYDELVRRERLGQQPNYEEYYERFPQWREELRKSFDIHDALVRRGADSTGQESTLVSPGVARASVDQSGWGSYQVLGEIGRGGMGVVYRARQPGLNRIVALKMIRSGEDAGPEEQARFRREAETAARLQHPNVVQVYEVGELAGRPYLAMEYVAGGNLADRLKDGPLPALEAARLLETLARAVQYAHEQGVLHRDLKPANILLVKSPIPQPTSPTHATLDWELDVRNWSLTPKVSDFGLAKQLTVGPEAADTGGLTQTGAVVGTPSYMAPEQARGSLEHKRAEGIGPAADVWALGVILYESLAGRTPFQGETVFETLQLVQSAEPMPPSRLRPKLPRDLETICLKCLEKDPRKRYASAADLADDLQRYLDNRPITARPVSAAARAWRWCQRKPAIAGLAATLATVIIASLAGLTYLWLRADRFATFAQNQQHVAETHLGEALRQQQRAQTSYQLAQEAFEESVKKVAEDPRFRRGPMEDVRRTALQAETAFYQKFVELQGAEPAFQAERGRAFTRLGDVTVELGDQNKAIEHYRHAQEVLSTLVQDYPGVPKYQAALAVNQHQLAKVYANTRKDKEAEEYYGAALTAQINLANNHPEDFPSLLNLVRTHTNLGQFHYVKLSRAREATTAIRNDLARSCEESCRSALDHLDKWARRHSTPLEAHYPRAVIYVGQGKLHLEMGRRGEAERCLGQARAILDRFVREHPDHEDFAQAQGTLANVLNTLATVYFDDGRSEDAEQVYQEVLVMQQNLVREHPLVWSHAVGLGNAQNNLGNLMRLGGQSDVALDWLTKAIATLEPLLAKQPGDGETRSVLTKAHIGAGAALMQLGRHADALAHLDRTLELDDGRYNLMARLARAQALAHVKEHVRATAEANALLTEVKIDHPGLFHGTACVFAVAAATVPPNDPLFGRYGARAVDLLRLARKAGYEGIDRWKEASEFKVLRDRDDFQRLFRDPK